jgi:hypothetical protein
MTPAVPATCQISIHGSFDQGWADYLGEMLLDMDVQAGQVNTTTFSGHAPDLAAFIGMLNLFANQGISVIACEYGQNKPLDMEESAGPLSVLDQRP